MDIVYLQLEPARELVPWYHVSRLRELSQYRRQQLFLQASFLATYLSDASTASGCLPTAPKNAILKCVDDLRRGGPTIPSHYADRIRATQSII